MNSSATRSPTAAILARENRPRSCPRSEFMGTSLTRPRLPAAVHPEPMIRMRPDLVLERPVELSGQVLDGRVPRMRGGERPAHPDQVRAVRAPDGDGSEDRSAAAQREHRGSRSGAGLLAEEVHEDAPAR